MKRNIFAYEGDGIGPEIMGAIQTILQAADVPLHLDIDPKVVVGERALLAGLEVLPNEFINKFKKSHNGVMLKAPLGTPKGEGFESINVQVRRLFDLYANIRPAKSIPGIQVMKRLYVPHVVVVRENIKASQGHSELTALVGVSSKLKTPIFNIEDTVSGEKVHTTFVITKDVYIDALRQAANDTINARKNKVTLVHKANIVKAFSLALTALETVKSEFPDLTFEEMIVDNFCMQMIIDPLQFHTVVLPEMFSYIYYGIEHAHLNQKYKRDGSKLSDYYENIDLVLLRENTEDLYNNDIMYNNDTDPDLAIIHFTVSEHGYRRIFEAAVHEAKKRGQESITFVYDIATFEAYNLGGKIFDEIAKEYPEYSFQAIDTMIYVQQVINYPEKFQVVVTNNMLGDILSDLHAGLVGGLGVTGSANIGDKYAMFEAVHGTAPTIAGQNKANPTALLMATIMMLQHLGLNHYAEQIEFALLETLKNPETRTGDLGGSLGTKEFVKALVQNIKKVQHEIVK